VPWVSCLLRASPSGCGGLARRRSLDVAPPTARVYWQPVDPTVALQRVFLQFASLQAGMVAGSIRRLGGGPVIRVDWKGAAALAVIMIVFSVHGFATGVTREGVGFLVFALVMGVVSLMLRRPRR
jgi:hypothetical protein